MTRKKRLLFTIDSLRIGGAEKSLITLLSMLDFAKYDVDLQLFSNNGELMENIPPEVRVLSLPEHTGFFSQPISKKVLSPAKFLRHLKYSFCLRKKGISNSRSNLYFWKLIGPYIKVRKQQYDIAIAYSQGVPTYFTIEKVNAAKKFGWINAEIKCEEVIKSELQKFYVRLDKIVAVSERVRDYLIREIFSDLNDKITVIKDILNPNTIRELSSFEAPSLKEDGLSVIMTVARLDKDVKGYDIALKTAVELKSRGVKFKWYVIGDGPDRENIQEYIDKNDLKDRFVLLGSVVNPYPFMKQCDIYVQTSRREGFGLTIAEAKILNRPVICTRFKGSELQITHEKNGLLSSFAHEEIADKIECLLNDKALACSIQLYQKEEKIGNTEEIEMFYKLIEE